ncbi:pentatricopeptide repeat-containing protein At5g61800-like [Prosopis cineraria]|uniref:pentatricopeptide repeat-containing protein At5g61800-like n=1 Tax=Prosopis cineraria TaxID=364024 RepID=UPI00240F8DCA|nr:pentatricopeptide repeat-containing protein At5g61800-like [Prosopis cineraria]
MTDAKELGYMNPLSGIKQCKFIKQLHQLHAHSITSGLLFLHPSHFLDTILHTFVSILIPANLAKSASFNPSSYALSIFRSIPNPSTFSYNNLIRVHSLLSTPLCALQIFTLMRRLCVPPDFHTFPFVLKACAQLRVHALSQSVHSQALKFGFVAHLFVLNSLVHVYSIHNRIDDAYQVFAESSDKDVVSYNAMIDGFVKTQQITRAREMFDRMPVRDAVSWGTMIAGYTQANLCNDALELFNKILVLELRPDNIALVSVLSACAQLGELEQGKIVHEYITRNGIRVDSFLTTALVDFYAKCGCLEAARTIFDSSADKNVFTWNAMLAGLAMHGKGSILLDYFFRMIGAGIQPDGVSFLAVLMGCSHAGLLHEARKLLNEMEPVYRIPPELRHYGCMVDMLGRAGLIGEAMELIKGMPCGGDIFVWGGLLGGCRTHGNLEIAKKAAQQVMEIKPEDGGVYSIMANLYAYTGQWDDVVKIRRLLSANKRAKKIIAFSLIRLNDDHDLESENADSMTSLN